MTPFARTAIVAAALVAVVALFVASAGSDDGESDSATTQRNSATTQRNAPRSTTGSRTPQPQEQTLERIVVRGGKPVGGVKRLEYENGERVRFSVRSDVADEVHVHGFDIKKDVSARGSVRVAFPADIEGVFEIELEHSHVQIGELRVNP
jgi:hypothetical protein